MSATRYLSSTKREASWPALLAVLAFTFSHYVALSQRLEIMSMLRNELLLGLASALFAVGMMLADPMRLGAGRRVAFAYIAFLFMVMIQVPFAMDPISARFTFSEHVLKQSIFVFFVATLLRSPRHVALFLAVYLAALFYILQESVRGLISGSLVWLNQGIMRLHGAVDRYGHPNGLSLVGVSVLPFLFYMRAVWRRPWMRLAMLACLIAAVLCIVNTGSRAGYVGVVAGLVTIWLASKHKGRDLVIVSVVAAGGFLALPEQYKMRFETIGGDEIEGASKEARMLLMQDAWEIFLEYPYGVGVDSFTYVRHVKYGGTRKQQEVHNLYLQVLTHLGIQGLVTFVWLIVSLFRCHMASLSTLREANDVVARAGRRGQIDFDRNVQRFLDDSRILEMSIRSIRFFMIMMLFNGMFAQTAYHILWCFVVGTSIATAAVAENLSGVAQRFLRLQAEVRAEV